MQLDWDETCAQRAYVRTVLPIDDVVLNPEDRDLASDIVADQLKKEGLELKLSNDARQNVFYILENDRQNGEFNIHELAPKNENQTQARAAMQQTIAPTAPTAPFLSACPM